MNETIRLMSNIYLLVGVVLFIIAGISWWLRRRRIRRRLSRIEQLRELEKQRAKIRNRWDEVSKRINPHDTLCRGEKSHRIYSKSRL